MLRLCEVQAVHPEISFVLYWSKSLDKVEVGIRDIQSTTPFKNTTNASRCRTRCDMSGLYPEIIRGDLSISAVWLLELRPLRWLCKGVVPGLPLLFHYSVNVSPVQIYILISRSLKLTSNRTLPPLRIPAPLLSYFVFITQLNNCGNLFLFCSGPDHRRIEG